MMANTASRCFCRDSEGFMHPAFELAVSHTSRAGDSTPRWLVTVGGGFCEREVCHVFDTCCAPASQLPLAGRRCPSAERREPRATARCIGRALDIAGGQPIGAHWVFRFIVTDDGPHQVVVLAAAPRWPPPLTLFGLAYALSRRSPSRNPGRSTATTCHTTSRSTPR